MPTTIEKQLESLQEFTDSRGVALRVDRHGGVLSGVKLIGLHSRNGREYREAALQQAVPLYEQARVNVNHPKEGPLAPRDYQDRIGTIRSVEFRPGEGLFGNLHFNPRHALAEQLVWDAEHNPRNVGFSHNVQARVTRTDEGLIVEEITRVQSVDLVADPATTEGLFEQAEGEGKPDIVAANMTKLTNMTNMAKNHWDALTLETLRLHRPDLLAEIETSPGDATTAGEDELTPRIAALERRLDQLTGPRSREQFAVIESQQYTQNPRDFARALKMVGRNER